MPHFTDDYCEGLLVYLHRTHPADRFFRQEVFTVGGLLTAVLTTYDGISDDRREDNQEVLFEAFLDRMSRVKPDWKYFDRENMEELARKPDKTIMGWEGRTIYFIKGGKNREWWTAKTAHTDMLGMVVGISAAPRGAAIRGELNTTAAAFLSMSAQVCDYAA